MILIIDNYDGCANNIYQLVGQMEPDILIVHHDQINALQILEMSPSHIIISGGSGAPEKAGNAIEIVRTVAGQIPVLGICLGCRIICAAFGGRIAPMDHIEQGRREIVRIEKNRSPLFQGIPDAIYEGFYRSETIIEESITDTFSVIARGANDVVGIAHKTMQIYGLQFHPESFLSEYGKEILANFLRICSD